MIDTTSLDKSLSPLFASYCSANPLECRKNVVLRFSILLDSTVILKNQTEKSLLEPEMLALLRHVGLYSAFPG